MYNVLIEEEEYDTKIRIEYEHRSLKEKQEKNKLFPRLKDDSILHPRLDSYILTYIPMERSQQCTKYRSIFSFHFIFEREYRIMEKTNNKLIFYIDTIFCHEVSVDDYVHTIDISYYIM